MENKLFLENLEGAPWGKNAKDLFGKELLWNGLCIGKAIKNVVLKMAFFSGSDKNVVFQISFFSGSGQNSPLGSKKEREAEQTAAALRIPSCPPPLRAPLGKPRRVPWEKHILELVL